MEKVTRSGVITSLIKETAAYYSITEVEVEEQLCWSLSEVLSSKFGYKVDVELTKEGLSLIGRIYQDGIEKDVKISPSRIKMNHLSKVEALLKERLDNKETNPLLIKYKRYERTVVTGLVRRKTSHCYYVSLLGIDDGVMGICEMRNMSPKERGSISGSEADFYVNHVKIERLGDRQRVVFQLSRASREFPCELLRKVSGDKELVVKCAKRSMGIVCHLSTNKYITKRNIERLRKALRGEVIVLSMIDTPANGCNA